MDRPRLMTGAPPPFPESSAPGGQPRSRESRARGAEAPRGTPLLATSRIASAIGVDHSNGRATLSEL